MRIWQALFNIIGLVLIVFWLSISIRQTNQFDDFYASAALKAKTEYATEAAIYTYVGNNIFWVDTYGAMMCNEYNMMESKTNQDRIFDSVDAAIFVSNSSVEALMRNKFLKEFSVQLIPIVYNYSATEKIMMDAFGDKVKYYRSTDDLLIEATNLDELVYVLNNWSIHINMDDLKADRKIELTKIVNKALLTSYLRMNETVDRTAYIPVDMINEFGINDIFGKTLIVIQKDFRNWNKRMITTAGYEKVERTWTIGFIEGGIKYYCREEEVPPGLVNAVGNKLFKNIYEAAAAGYVPATQYFK